MATPLIRLKPKASSPFPHCSTCYQYHPSDEKCPNAPQPVVTTLQKLVGRQLRYRRRKDDREAVGTINDAHASAVLLDGTWFHLGGTPEIDILGVKIV